MQHVDLLIRFRAVSFDHKCFVLIQSQLGDAQADGKHFYQKKDCFVFMAAKSEEPVTCGGFYKAAYWVYSRCVEFQAARASRARGEECSKDSSHAVVVLGFGEGLHRRQTPRDFKKPYPLQTESNGCGLWG